MMVRICSLLFVFASFSSDGLSQNRKTDSLLKQLTIVRIDTARVWVLAELCSTYRLSNTDSSIFYGDKALNLARQIKFLRGEANTLNRLSATFIGMGDLPRALELQYSALKISEENGFQLEKAACMRRIGFVYSELQNYKKAIGLFLTALKIDSAINNKGGETIAYDNLAMLYQYVKNTDSALYYNQKAFQLLSFYPEIAPEVYRVRGDIEAMNGQKNTAVNFYHQGLQIAVKKNDYRNTSFIYANLATFYRQMNQPDSGVFYALKGVESGQKSSFKKGILLCADLLAQLFDSINPSRALYYYKISAAVKESLFGAGNVQTVQALVAKEEERRREIELAKTAYQNRLKQYGLAGGLAVLCIIAFILYRNNRQKQVANKVLQNTLNDLKSTQAQLIQSEKMASLGQLTAGIAHEIQNPLNFVNNFSDVNAELIKELQTEIPLAMGDNSKNEPLLELLHDIAENEQKINHHGKRADSIVKGMLQHSRISTGHKEATDINALTEEYFRLALQAWRVKDAGFDTTLKPNFDKSISKINISPQDIGRVLLNLYNNAFYAVNERKKKEGEKYEPLVSISTQKKGDKVVITVNDNGVGIPQTIVEKIFQPFFTTKPTGQGTGLGLSLAYDIVKAHLGVLEVEAGRAEGTTFVLQLPVV